MSGLFNGLLVLLFLVHGGCSIEVNEGKDQDITCSPGATGSTTWWFRLKDNAEMEYITSSKPNVDVGSKFSKTKIESNILTVTKFEKGTDSGFYGCVIINNNKLHFGPVTRLQGTPDPKPKQIPTTTVTPQNILTKKSTVLCEHDQVTNVHGVVRLGCELVILIPLAVGSGLLLLILIITILYCNRIRTRRCPHHYKRQPRNRPPGHRPLPNHPDF